MTGQNKHDGFTAPVVVEPDTGRVTDTTVSSACGQESSDAHTAVEMLGDDPEITSGAVDEVLGDSADDSAEFLDVADEVGLTPVVKPRALTTPVPGGDSLDDVIVDDSSNTVTCPSGHTAVRGPQGRASFTPWCDSCPVTPQCTTVKKGRVVMIGVPQLRQHCHRQQARDPEFADRLRRHRPMVEPSLAWLMRPGRTTPYRGITTANAWVSIRAAAVNLKRLTSLGLTLVPAQEWALQPIG